MSAALYPEELAYVLGSPECSHCDHRRVLHYNDDDGNECLICVTCPGYADKVDA